MADVAWVQLPHLTLLVCCAFCLTVKLLALLQSLKCQETRVQRFGVGHVASTQTTCMSLALSLAALVKLCLR